ncbi:zinc finger protein 276 isoform X2 [Pleurodeles waltl]|uniref:zinc finger protein 276 isoform X2 n=1 Tax=Pleurodeles waltl TaxID=8319 RepID=UPI0037099F07
MKRDRRGRFLAGGLSRRLDRQAAAGKRRGGEGLNITRSLRDRGESRGEPEALFEETEVQVPLGWEAPSEQFLEDGVSDAGSGRSLTGGYCRLCHGKFSSRSLRNAFGKVPVMGNSSEKQRRVEHVLFADFQRLLGVSVQQDPSLPPFVCKNCHAQFYKCHSVLKTFMQKVNSSPTPHAKSKSRDFGVESQLKTGEEQCLDLITSSPQCLHRLVIWSHNHAGDCQAVPDLQSMLSSQYCGIIRAVWGCREGHAYVMDTDSDCSTLLMNSALSAKWNHDKSSEAHLTVNAASRDNSAAVCASRTPHGPAQADLCQQPSNNETTIQFVTLENQTSHCRNSSYTQLTSTAALPAKESCGSNMQVQTNSIQSSDSAAEEPLKDETSDLSEGDILSEDDEGEKTDQSVDDAFVPCSAKNTVLKKSIATTEAKRLEEPKERKKPGPKPGWKNKFKPEREELPTIYKCPYQGCTAVYRGADGMKSILTCRVGKQANIGVDNHAHYQQEKEPQYIMTRKTSSKKNNFHTSGPNNKWSMHSM